MMICDLCDFRVAHTYCCDLSDFPEDWICRDCEELQLSEESYDESFDEEESEEEEEEPPVFQRR